MLERAAKKFGFAIETTFFEWGAGFYKRFGHFMPKDGLDTLRAYDAVYFGASGCPTWTTRCRAKDYTFKVRTGFKRVRQLPARPDVARRHAPPENDAPLTSS